MVDLWQFATGTWLMWEQPRDFRGIDKFVRVGAGMLLSVYTQIFGHSPLTLKYTAIL